MGESPDARGQTEVQVQAVKPRGENWAAAHIAALKRGETVSFRPRGGSMSGRIEDGQLVTVEPVRDEPDTVIEVDDIVLVTIGDWTYVHLVKAICQRGNGVFYLIGNNRGRINGWVPLESIHGKVVSVSP